MTNIRHIEQSIKYIKDNFERKLAQNLNLERVSAPLFVTTESGLNDNLNGIERVVSFDIKNVDNTTVEIVQSLAKWKRHALSLYGFCVGEGLYTDMNAIRRDDDVDFLHSVYVDQWDWEKVIDQSQRNVEFLQYTVQSIIHALYQTNKKYIEEFDPKEKLDISEKVFFVTSQQLEDMYPDKTPKQREEQITKDKKVVFIMQIGDKLKSGEKHDGRAPDYDDWSMNGDILVWHEKLQIAMEISSMGIRVDKEALKSQLKKAGCEDRAKMPFHKSLLEGKLPLTIGGGIGQSRLCMLIMQKQHIGQVQVSVWNENDRESLRKKGVHLL